MAAQRGQGEGTVDLGRIGPEKADEQAPRTARGAVVEQDLEALHGVARPGMVPGDDDIGGRSRGGLKAAPRGGGKLVLNHVGWSRRHGQNLSRRADQVAEGQARPRQEGRRLADGRAHRVRGRVAAEQTARVASQALPVQRAQGRTMAAAREDQLPAPAKTGLEMRQDRPDQDAHLGLDHRPKDADGNPSRRPSELDVMETVIDGRAEAGVLPADLGAEALPHGVAAHRRMPADTHADGDVHRWDARRVQASQHDRQRLRDGRPARRVIDHDRHRHPWTDRRPDIGRIQDRFQGGRVIVERARQIGPDHLGRGPCGRQLERQARALTPGNADGFGHPEALPDPGISRCLGKSNLRDSRCQIPDSRFQIPDPRFQIPDSRFQIPDSRFQIPDPR